MVQMILQPLPPRQRRVCAGSIDISVRRTEVYWMTVKIITLVE